MVPGGQWPSTWHRTTALQLRVLGSGPLMVEAFPWGHCVTMQDTVPAHPVLCGPPRHCHLAAPQGSLTGGCGPFPEQPCPPSASWAKESKVSSLLSVRWPRAGPGPRPLTSSWHQRLRPQQIAFAQRRPLGARLRAASSTSLNLDKVLWGKETCGVPWFFPVIVSWLALLVRFSKIRP